MRTPNDWTKNLKNGILTEEMLDSALFSVNKRAKNCRDKKREYHHTYDYYHNAERYETQENAYYAQKDELLSVLTPICIHREHLGFEKKRHYDNEPGFMDNLARCLCAGTITWSNSFINHHGHDDYDNYYDDFDDFDDSYLNRTYFFDEALLDQEIIHYYLFMRLGNTHSILLFSWTQKLL